KSFQDLLQKREGVRAVWEYPFAVAGVNITFMLIQMLDLQAGFQIEVLRHHCLLTILVTAAKPTSMMAAVFLKLLSVCSVECFSYWNFASLALTRVFPCNLPPENERAFDVLYCMSFKMMDQQWLAMRASYMDFNVRCSIYPFLVMKSTRRQLEQELLLEDIQRIEDMPSYSLLKR
ncbi:hypothetical protein B296_00046743, partial [Ensete ventricosum]